MNKNMQILNNIEKIQIKKFRKIEDLTLEFKIENFFVLAGKNATGKTSILEAINIAFSERGSKFTEIKETDFFSDEPIEFIVDLKYSFFLSFDDNQYKRLIPCKSFVKRIRRRLAKERGSLFSPPYEVLWEFKPIDFNPDQKTFEAVEEKYKGVLDRNQKIVRTFKLEDKNKFSYTTKTVKEPVYKDIIGFQYLNKVLFPEVFYFDRNRERELLTNYNTTLANIINELDWRYKKKIITDQKNKEKIIQNYENLSLLISGFLTDDKNENYQEKILKIAKEIFSNKIGEVELDVKSLSFFFLNYYQPFINSIFGVKSKSGQIIPSLNVGSGLSTVLSLALSISFALQNDSPTIILIDEPEIHLEPELQKKLCRYLIEEIKFQTIVATHSHLFLNKKRTKNNVLLENQDDKIIRKYCETIDLCDLEFRLLGNSIDDLIIPERIILVEGKYDKNIIFKCLELLGKIDLQIQIVSVGGKDNIPDKSENYKQVLDEILKKSKWYSNHIIKIIKIVVDNNVSNDKINSWAQEYSFEKDKQIKKISKEGIEYLYPKSLIKKCTESTENKDGSNLSLKSKEEIIKIIFDDDRQSDKNLCEQVKNRVSKSRLNNFVINNLSKDILEDKDCTELKELINWVIN